MKKLNYKAVCFSCKASELNNIPAQFYVSGHDGCKPFKGYVCEDHYEMLSTNGMIKNSETIDLDYIVSYHTGFKNFDAMVKSANYCYTPTLRVDVIPELKIVRQAFNDKMAELGLENRA